MFSLLFTTGNTWNITACEWCIPTSSKDIVMCLCLLCVAVFSFPPQSVSPNLFHMPQWCVQCQFSLLTTAMFSLLFTTGNTWNITAREWCIPTSSNDIVMWMCCCVLLFLLPTSGESQSFPHAPMMCAVSVILANDCHVFSPLHYWEHLEHNRAWVMHPYIF